MKIQLLHKKHLLDEIMEKKRMRTDFQREN
jgi:hypothetical protein